MSVAECNGCHTQRDMSGAFTGQPFGGGGEWIENGMKFMPPNLTPDSTGWLFGWSQQNFIDRFRKGKLIKQSPMPWNSFKRMDDEELKAIYNFLQSLPPVKNKTAPPELVETKK
jgi:mono/diheme cytochrome c family protein